MDDLFPEGYFFQQDGSPIHRADIVTDFIKNSMPYHLMSPEYLFYSPDLSPIENIWGWLKNQVNRDMPLDVKNLKKCIKKHWNSLNSEFLKPYYDSMPDRMDFLIECEGNKINYLCIRNSYRY